MTQGQSRASPQLPLLLPTGWVREREGGGEGGERGRGEREGEREGGREEGEGGREREGRREGEPQEKMEVGRREKGAQGGGGESLKIKPSCTANGPFTTVQTPTSIHTL